MSQPHFEERGQRRASLSTLIDGLRQSVQQTLFAIKRIAAHGRLSDGQKLAQIEHQLNLPGADPRQMELQFDEFEQSATKNPDYGCKTPRLCISTEGPARYFS
jgi:hypothetical protein